MNCSVYGAFFCESDLLRSLLRGCVPSAFFLGVLIVALLELPSCRSQDRSCGLLGLWPLSCQRMKCCLLRYLPDAGPVLVVALRVQEWLPVFQRPFPYFRTCDNGWLCLQSVLLPLTSSCLIQRAANCHVLVLIASGACARYWPHLYH